MSLKMQDIGMNLVKDKKWFSNNDYNDYLFNTNTRV